RSGRGATAPAGPPPPHPPPATGSARSARGGPGPGCVVSPPSPPPCSPTSAWRSRRQWKRPPVSAEARSAMVDRQLRRRGIGDERVLSAMARVARELFVPEERREAAYADAALPIGHHQTISQPYMVALICERLSLQRR